MGQPKNKSGRTKRSTVRPTGNRIFELSIDDQRFLKKVGLKIHKQLFEQGRSVERLALELGIARSTLREIIAGRSNLRILTLCSISSGLGYGTLVEFLSDI